MLKSENCEMCGESLSDSDGLNYLFLCEDCYRHELQCLNEILEAIREHRSATNQD